MRLPVLWLALLLPGLAAAQGGPSLGIPEAAQGAWVQGECTAPEAVLQVTGRSIARLPGTGDSRLYRLAALRDLGGWAVGTAEGPEAPRVMLRAAGEALETAEPEAKLRDDRLPGETPITRWRRCPALPASLGLLHAEGVAVLAALEHLEAACDTEGTAACLAAIVAQADVSGDGLLAPAELARLARGLGWVIAVQDGADRDTLAAVAGLGALAGVLAARTLVESLDFNGDGRLSAAELAQDRASFGAARGTAAGRPVPGAMAAPGLEALRGLVGGLGLLK